jgi:tetratricopeptide (TPR) repeat protein
MLAGGEIDRGLDRLADLQKRLTEPATAAAMGRVPSAERAATIERALDAATARGRTPRELSDLRLWLLQLSVAADESFYWRAAPEYLAQLERDSGLLDWRALSDVADRGQRLQQALGAAAKRHAETPERERVSSPKEAIQKLVYYVVASIAVGSRTLNAELMDSLPPLLEPFVPLAPLVDIIWNNATALAETNCRAQPERGRARWIDVYEKLGKVSAAEVPYVGRLRNAVLFGISAHDVRMGKASSAEWTDLLGADPSQRVSALYLRKVMALQAGDTAQAERCRKEAEVLALQAQDPQMFNATLPLELGAHVLSGDLTGIQQVMARMQPLAQRSAGWRAYLELADGHFQRLRGDLEAACAAFERCLSLVSPGGGGRQGPLVVWPLAVAGYGDTLLERRRYEEARTFAEKALGTCKALGIGFLAHDVARVLALAEARLGDHAQAAARLDDVIAEKVRDGVAGLPLGAFHEARARVAIWAGDDAALQAHAALAAKEYRHGQGSALGARWERLMAEARAAARRARTSDGAPDDRTTGYRTSFAQVVGERLSSASTAEERARRTVMLLCDDRRARIGHLYLVGERGVAHAASYGEGADAPEGLLDFVRASLDAALSEDSDKTAALTRTQMASLVTGGTRFRDGAGTEYRVVLLTIAADGALQHVGAAAFVEDGDAALAGGAGLVATLSAYLLRVGDAQNAAAIAAGGAPFQALSNE